MKIISAITNTAMLATNTAAAAKSFILPAFKWYSGEIKLTISSIAVLTNSILKTKPIQKSIINHSKFERCTAKPNATTKAVEIKCNLKFLSDIADLIPLNAKENDFNIEC